MFQEARVRISCGVIESLMLSTTAKEAIKIALSITAGYYIALRFAWLSPTWVAISVAMISLPTAGQSLNKGLLRMGGTLLAFVVGLAYLGLYPQDRWLFFIAFTPYLAFVTYKLTGKNGQYFWYVAGFVSMMIVTALQGGAAHAFIFAVFRALETLVGIMLWTLVSVFIWPRTNLGALINVSRELLATQAQRTRGYQDWLAGHRTDEALQPVQSQEGKLVVQLRQTIEGAASESYEVREVRPLWEQLHGLTSSIMEIGNRLQSGFVDLQQFDITKVIPHLEAFFSELEARYEEARNVLGGQPPAHPCKPMRLVLSPTDVHALDHFQRAAVEVTRHECERLERLTGAMVACARALRGDATEAPRPVPVAQAGPSTGPFGLTPLDPDRIRASIMVVTSMWVASLLWIYFDPPGHAAWYQFVPTLALIAVQTPHLKFGLLKPFAVAYLVGLTVYVFVMPQLSVFWELGLLIFAFSFVAAYFFSGISRIALYLAIFNMLAIENQQTYDFAAVANTYVFTMLAVSLVFGLSYIIRSPRPEKALLSMVRRFFRSGAFLLSHVAASAQPTSLLARAKTAYYRQELQSLPGKLGMWGPMIDHQKYPHNTPDHVINLVASLQVLASRIEMVIETCAAPQATVLIRELRDDFGAWRAVIEQGFTRQAEGPHAEAVANLQERLSVRLTRLNLRIEAALNRVGVGELSDEASRNFYQLLGSCRALSQAAIAYGDAASHIDWVHWREERF